MLDTQTQGGIIYGEMIYGGSDYALQPAIGSDYNAFLRKVSKVIKDNFH